MRIDIEINSHPKGEGQLTERIVRVAWASVKVLDAGKDWKKTCGSAIVRLVQSSAVGEAMFTALIGPIVGDTLKTTLEEELVNLWSTQKEKVDDAVVAEWTEKLLTKADTIDGIDQLESRRLVTLTYRGAELQVPIRCMAEEVQMRIMCVVKGIAVQSKVLSALHAEVLLGYDKDFYKVKFEIDKQLVAKVGGTSPRGLGQHCSNYPLGARCTHH